MRRIFGVAMAIRIEIPFWVEAKTIRGQTNGSFKLNCATFTPINHRQLQGTDWSWHDVVHQSIFFYWMNSGDSSWRKTTFKPCTPANQSHGNHQDIVVGCLVKSQKVKDLQLSQSVVVGVWRLFSRFHDSNILNLKLLLVVQPRLHLLYPAIILFSLSLSLSLYLLPHSRCPIPLKNQFGTEVLCRCP